METSAGEEKVGPEPHVPAESHVEDATMEKDKKGILAHVPEISKWELDENQVESSAKQSEARKKSPDVPVKVTREVIKRAENAIFKRAVNAIREPSKMASGTRFAHGRRGDVQIVEVNREAHGANRLFPVSDKEERKDRKLSIDAERDRFSSKDVRADQDAEKSKRIFLVREKEKSHRNSFEVIPFVYINHSGPKSKINHKNRDKIFFGDVAVCVSGFPIRNQTKMS